MIPREVSASWRRFNVVLCSEIKSSLDVSFFIDRFLNFYDKAFESFRSVNKTINESVLH